MYDKTKVIAGLVFFLGLATAPFWISNLGLSGVGGHGHGSLPPGECVEPRDWMVANHMLLLNDWRNSVVRDGEKTYTNSAGKEFEMSLTNTCLGCHSNKVTITGEVSDNGHVDPPGSAPHGHGEKKMAAKPHVDPPGAAPHGHGEKKAAAKPHVDPPGAAPHGHGEKKVAATMTMGNSANNESLGKLVGDDGRPAQFCKECHEPMSVKPYCWSCHLGPKE